MRLVSSAYFKKRPATQRVHHGRSSWCTWLPGIRRLLPMAFLACPWMTCPSRKRKMMKIPFRHALPGRVEWERAEEQYWLFWSSSRCIRRQWKGHPVRPCIQGPGLPFFWIRILVCSKRIASENRSDWIWFFIFFHKTHPKLTYGSHLENWWLGDLKMLPFQGRTVKLRGYTFPWFRNLANHLGSSTKIRLWEANYLPQILYSTQLCV